MMVVNAMAYRSVPNFAKSPLLAKKNAKKRKSWIPWIILSIVTLIALYEVYVLFYPQELAEFKEKLTELAQERFRNHTISKLVHFKGPAKDISQMGYQYQYYIQSWKDLNPEYEIKYYNDDQAEEFVAKNYPQYIHLYLSLPLDILRVDFFRYLVLYKLGGIYSDTDTTCLKPISHWISDKEGVEFITGLEADVCFETPCLDDWEHKFARPIQLVQWTIASAPGHPLLGRLIKKIVNNSANFFGKKSARQNDHVMDWTGPGVFTDAVFEYLEIFPQKLSRLSSPKQYGSVLILPLTGFEPEAHPEMGSKSIYDDHSMVQHHFAGSWK